MPKAPKSPKSRKPPKSPAPSPLGMTPSGVPTVPPQPIPAATPIRQAATSSAFPLSNTSPLDCVRVHDKEEGKDFKGWTVEEVANWLRREKFDQDVCDKFTVNDIRGEVLLALDINNLKSDFGIESFGTRYAIMEAIKKLRSEAASQKRGDPFPDEGKGKGKQPRIEDAPWLVELHNKLWGRADLFDKVFRAVDLTREDFIELQSNLHHLHGSRNHMSYVAEDVLETKMTFLQSRTATHPLTIAADSLVPKVVLRTPEGPVTMDEMDFDVDITSEKIIKQQEDRENKGIDEDAKSNEDDEDADSDEDDDGDDGDEDDGGDEDDDGDENDKSYIDEDAAVLSHGPTAVFPCTVKYMDLTCLKLRHFERVSKVLLIRDEWNALVDIFNKRTTGIRGGALWTGQPGTGKTALSCCILVICLIKAQPIVYQDKNGAVYIINKEVQQQMGGTVGVQGDDVLALVDGDGKTCQPDGSIVNAVNLRILLTSSPRVRSDRRWLTQDVRDEYASYVVGPWSWDEFSVASLFLSQYDITLRRLRKATKFCGLNPRQLFETAISPETLQNAETTVFLAIRNCKDIGRAIDDVAGDLAIPHRAFMIYPGDERRKLLDCLVKPVSDWALDVIINTLDSRGAEAAYDLYQDIEGSRSAASFRGQLWERKVHRYFCSGNVSSFTIQCLEDGDSSTVEWEPFKNISSFNFGPSRALAGRLKQCITANNAGYFRPKSKNFASFDAIIFEPSKPLLGLQITENSEHTIDTRGPKLVQKLLSPSDTALKPLRPLVTNPWTILFVVPIPMQTTFAKQKFKPDVVVWKKKTKQYVLGLDKYAVFHCSSQSSSQ